MHENQEKPVTAEELKLLTLMYERTISNLLVASQALCQCNNCRVASMLAMRSLAARGSKIALEGAPPEVVRVVDQADAMIKAARVKTNGPDRVFAHEHADRATERASAMASQILADAKGT